MLSSHHHYYRLKTVRKVDFDTYASMQHFNKMQQQLLSENNWLAVIISWFLAGFIFSYKSTVIAESVVHIIFFEAHGVFHVVYKYEKYYYGYFNEKFLITTCTDTFHKMFSLPQQMLGTLRKMYYHTVLTYPETEQYVKPRSHLLAYR